MEGERRVPRACERKENNDYAVCCTHTPDIRASFFSHE